MNDEQRRAANELAAQRAQIDALSARRRAERLAGAREREEALFNQPGLIDRLLAGLARKPAQPERDADRGPTDREAA
ncbi:MAG TPA: hypothetical protein VFW96_16285 [Thermomicrobiales bacterium]|nr:hypothetical protein [Thermomicrobiales bacterium]